MPTLKSPRPLVEILDGETSRLTLQDSKDILTLRITDNAVTVHWEGKKVIVQDHQTIKPIHTSLEVGRFEFRFIECPNGGYYKMTLAYIEGIDGTFKNRGIGREAVIFFKDYVGYPIKCSPNDGIPRDDGSHLTGDAPGFVHALVNEGLVEQEQTDSEN